MHRAYLSCWLAFLISGCDLGELRKRQIFLQELVATNATLGTVENEIGRVPIYRKDTKDWNEFRSAYARRVDPKSKRILQKTDKAAAVGFTSTISMQTFIFLDQQDKLIDFEVDAQ